LLEDDRRLGSRSARWEERPRLPATAVAGSRRDMQVLYATTDLSTSQAVGARGSLRLLTAAALTDLGWTRLD
jgi:hypothetical protein